MGEPLSVAAIRQAVEPLTGGKRLSRGTRRRLQQALESGVDQTAVTRSVVAAAVVAGEEGRSKIGSFGGQRRFFERMDERARMEEVQTRQTELKEKLRRRRGW